MTKEQILLDLIKRKNGMITTACLKKNNIQSIYLTKLLEKKLIVKVARGVYSLPHLLNDDLLNLQTRYKRGIYSLETALYLHGLTDTTPFNYTMSFKQGYNCTNPKKENVICKLLDKDLYDLGITQVKTYNDNLVFVYNVERTLCDILRPINNVDVNIITEAFKIYFKMFDVSIYMLSKYAKILNVEEKIRMYVGVLY